MTESAEWTECLERLVKEGERKYQDHLKRWDKKLDSLCREWARVGRRLKKTRS